MATKTIKALYEANEKRLNVAMARVYASAPNDATPFSGCYANAPDDVKADYDTASSERARLQYEAIKAGKAYRNGVFQTFTWTIRKGR